MVVGFVVNRFLPRRGQRFAEGQHLQVGAHLLRKRGAFRVPVGRVPRGQHFRQDIPGGRDQEQRRREPSLFREPVKPFQVGLQLPGARRLGRGDQVAVLAVVNRARGIPPGEQLPVRAHPDEKIPPGEVVGQVALEGLAQLPAREAFQRNLRALREIPPLLRGVPPRGQQEKQHRHQGRCKQQRKRRETQLWHWGSPP